MFVCVSACVSGTPVSILCSEVQITSSHEIDLIERVQVVWLNSFFVFLARNRDEKYSNIQTPFSV
jgi:hypothetical protein